MDHFHPPLPQPESPGAGSGNIAVPSGHEPRAFEARPPSQSARQFICWSHTSAGLMVEFVRQWPLVEPVVTHWHSRPLSRDLSSHEASVAGPSHTSSGGWHFVSLPLRPQLHLLPKDASVALHLASVVQATQGSVFPKPPLTGASVAPQVVYASHR